MQWNELFIYMLHTSIYVCISGYIHTLCNKVARWVSALWSGPNPSLQTILLCSQGQKGGQYFPDQLLSTSWPVWYDTQEVRHFQFSIYQVHRYSLIAVSGIVYILFPALFLSVSHAGAPAVLGLSRSVLSEVFSVFWLLIDACKCFRMSKHVPVKEPVFKSEGLLALCCVLWESNHDFYVPASIHSKIACFSTLFLTTVTPGSEIRDWYLWT